MISPTECSICLEPYNDAVSIPCGNFFHVFPKCPRFTHFLSSQATYSALVVYKATPSALNAARRFQAVRSLMFSLTSLLLKVLA